MPIKESIGNRSKRIYWQFPGGRRIGERYAGMAGVRKSSSRAYLKDPRIQFAELDFAHPGRLTEQLAVHKQLHQGWDISFIVPVLLNAVIKTNSTKVIMFIPVIL